MRQFIIKRINPFITNEDGTGKQLSLTKRIVLIPSIWIALRIWDILYLLIIPPFAVILFLAECLKALGEVGRLIVGSLTEIAEHNINDVKALKRIATNTHGLGKLVMKKKVKSDAE